jgi:hypothetical protein
MDEGAEGPEIILVGVVHGDPGGYDKLINLFDRVRPRVISVEISEYSWRYRRSREAWWQRRFQQSLQSLPPDQRKHLALKKVAAQIAPPFEARAAEDYAQQHGVAWQAVDIKAIAREHLARYGEELLSPDNLGNLVLTPDGDWGEYIRQEYRRARRVLQTGPGGGFGWADTVVSPQAAKREKVLAVRVRRLAKQWLRVVHVGGWEHLTRLGPRKTMADYLAAWSPQLLLLDEAIKSSNED